MTIIERIGLAVAKLGSAMALFFLSGTAVHAAVVVSGTRFVYDAGEREVTVRLDNEDKSIALIQAWIDSGERAQSPSTIQVPFTIAPPIFRMEPGRSQVLRIIHTREPMPQEKESLFFLNVLELPPRPEGADKKSLLEFSVRSRMKLIYRPKGLSGTPDEAAKAVRWHWEPVTGEKPAALLVENPSPYYVTLTNVTLMPSKIAVAFEDGTIAPGGSLRLPLMASGKDTHVDAGADEVARAAAPHDSGQIESVSYQYVDDHSGRYTVSATIQ